MEVVLCIALLFHFTKLMYILVLYQFIWRMLFPLYLAHWQQYDTWPKVGIFSVEVPHSETSIMQVVLVLFFLLTKLCKYTKNI